jgi:hypothetical protein
MKSIFVILDYSFKGPGEGKLIEPGRAKQICTSGTSPHLPTRCKSNRSRLLVGNNKVLLMDHTNCAVFHAPPCPSRPLHLLTHVCAHRSRVSSPGGEN